VSGTAMASATATGPHTLFGDVAVRLATRAPETEFEHGLRRFSLLILRTTVVLVLFIVLVGVALKHDPFESLLFAVALGVGLTPEFLPMIASITLTQGALRMARERVIVKHLPAIQNFGSIDVFCTDKTGTLTTGVMQHDDRRVLVGRQRLPCQHRLLNGQVARFDQASVGGHQIAGRQPKHIARHDGAKRHFPPLAVAQHGGGRRDRGAQSVGRVLRLIRLPEVD